MEKSFVAGNKQLFEIHILVRKRLTNKNFRTLIIIVSSKCIFL